MKSNISSTAKWMLMIQLVLVAAVTISASAFAEAIDIEKVMITPNELDNGYWVNAYQDYLSSNAGRYQYVALVDLNLDGIPEMVAVKEIEKAWYVIADIVCIDRNGSLQVTEYDELQMDTVISLYIGDEGPMWVRKEESDYKGTATLDYYRFTFTKNSGVMVEPWLSEYSEYDYWEIEEPTNTDYTRTYYVNGEEVSYEEYRKEDTKRRKMSYVVTVQLCGYAYPTDWATACAQYSILRK
ncbi:MAG: hypothetical protein IKG71_01120 [Firmicutes bacterium]|nr:hypothetical protein [Bacillota bacterium]